MSVPGLRLHIAPRAPHAEDFLWVGAHADADVPLQAVDELPFEDAAADLIVLVESPGLVNARALLQALLECRRVLRPGGELAVRTPHCDAQDAVRDLASLVGLDALGPGRRQSPAMDAVTRFTKRDRTLRGDPSVSIAIPAYNPRFFSACLDSALAQTHANLEIVVCDDSDGSEIEGIVASRPARRAIRYERNAERLRPRANFVRCFERSDGEFVKLLCDDDLLEPGCVATLLEAFRDAPDVTLATSRRLRVGVEGERLPDVPATTPILAEDMLVAGHTLANAMLMAGLNTLGEPSTALFRRAELLDRAPAYFAFRGEAGHGIIDMVTWSALLLKGNAVYFAEPLSRFRSHAGQRQRDPTKTQRNVDSIRALQAAWLDLGLAAVLAPDSVLAKPFPCRGEDWRTQPLLGFTARRQPC